MSKAYQKYAWVFGVRSLYYRIQNKINRAGIEIICPRCGKNGRVMQKTTISKKIYKYRKWYVYHEGIPKSYKRKRKTQSWCYLNKNQLERVHADKLKVIKHMEDVRRCLYECIRIRDEEFEWRYIS